MKSTIVSIVLLLLIFSGNLFSQSYRNFTYVNDYYFIHKTSDTLFNNFVLETKNNKNLYQKFFATMYGGWLIHMIYTGNFDGLNWYLSDSTGNGNYTPQPANPDNNQKLQPVKPIDINNSTEIVENHKKIIITKSEYIKTETGNNSNNYTITTRQKTETYIKPYVPPPSANTGTNSSSTNTSPKKGGNNNSGNKTSTEKKVE